MVNATVLKTVGSTARTGSNPVSSASLCMCRADKAQPSLRRVAQEPGHSAACCFQIVPVARLLLGHVAQRLEQGTHNPLVAGSNPAMPTISGASHG